MSTEPDLEVVESKTKIYESLAVKFDPQYDSSLKAIPIIKEFIRRRGLIIYGGTAMDYALRLVGDNIYPDEMLAVPDLDMYSNDSTADAYALAKILYNAGFTSARAIVGLYVNIMKVDIVDNHFLADISYVPKAIFDTLPVLEYEGMKIIDPIFQKIDLHSCMAFPFDNAPREVIFDKWKKYIERFNKFHKYYPTPTGDTVKLQHVSIRSRQLNRVLLDGFAAYGAIRRCLHLLNSGKKLPANILECDFTLVQDDNSTIINTETLENTIHIASYDTDECINMLSLTDVKYYASFVNVMPKHIVGKAASCDKALPVDVFVTSTVNKLITIHRFELDKIPVATVSIQFLLLRFLVCAHLSSGRIKNTYYAYYESTMRMIQLAEKIISAISDEADREKLIANAPFFMTTKVFGNANVSASYKLSIARIHADMHISTGDMPAVPKGYYPARGQIAEKFNYESSSYFIKDGRELKHEEN